MRPFVYPKEAPLFEFFKKRSEFDDQKKEVFVDAVSTMLELQLVAVGNRSIEDGAGNPNRNAMGYVYGFIDAALRTIGQDMGNKSVGMPITFQVLRRVFPGCEELYLQYLTERMGTDEQVMIGAMTGGQQYIDYVKGKLAAPMGLARYILDSQ